MDGSDRGGLWHGLAWHSTAECNIFLSCNADAQISIKNVSVCQEIIEILISYNGYLFHSYLGFVCFVLGFLLDASCYSLFYVAGWWFWWLS